MRRSTTEDTGRREYVAVPPLGIEIVWRAGMVAALRLSRAQAGHLDVDASGQARAVHAALVRLAAGQPAEFPDLPLDWDAVPPFTREVLAALCREAPHGATLSYGELARRAGHPGKARAVGQAMARNPWPLVVPCHRVLGAGGGLTGYTNPHGLALKELLLQLEGGPARG